VGSSIVSLEFLGAQSSGRRLWVANKAREPQSGSSPDRVFAAFSGLQIAILDPVLLQLLVV
jgi:hypothetical protein